MIYLGIDPGKSGAIAAIVTATTEPLTIKLTETEHDVSAWLRQFPMELLVAMVEQVSSSPQQGVVSAFTFGKSYGMLLGLLTAHKIPYRLVRPAVWQRSMGAMSGGDKRKTKAAAQRLWPTVKMTHAIADACLLAEYCRRNWGK